MHTVGFVFIITLMLFVFSLERSARVRQAINLLIDRDSIRVTALTDFDACVRLELALEAGCRPRWMIPGLVYGDVRPGPSDPAAGRPWTAFAS